MTKATGYQSLIGSHHAILYQARQQRPVDTHECTEDDMVNSIPVAINAGGEGGDASDGEQHQGAALAGHRQGRRWRTSHSSAARPLARVESMRSVVR